MPNQSGSDRVSLVHRTRFAATIDKLVAVQMDLKGICANAGATFKDGGHGTVAEACAILQSAIDDLKEVIRELEGSPAGERASASKPADGRGAD